MMDELARHSEQATAGAAETELRFKQRGVPVHHVTAGLTYDSGQLRGGHRPGKPSCSIRRAPPPEQARRGGTATTRDCSWAQASHLTEMCGWPRPG